MDFKGITWVGNIYQKFEAMCLEVEEIMYQDTVKYVENQVQTVGASVKKFYSDVMQDVLPPSSVDPVKLAAADLSPNPYAHVGIYKKPKASIKDDPIKVDKLLTGDCKMISGVDVDRTSSFSGLCDVNRFPSRSSRNSGEGARSELYSGQNEVGGMYEHSSVGIKGNSEKDNHPPSKMSRLSTLVSEDWSRVSSCCEISESHEAACDQIAMLSPPASVEVTGCYSREEGKICDCVQDSNVSIIDASNDSFTSDMIPAVESSGKKGTELRRTSSSGGLSSESVAAGTCTNSGFVSRIGSHTSGDTQYSESAGEVVFMPHTGRSGDCNTDVIENNDIIEQGMETIEEFDKSKLEETCVLVDGDKHCSVAQREGKHKSYKKKIREAFSSKKRSARKQEYEQLAAQYGDIDTVSNQESAEIVLPTLTMDSNTKKLPTHDFCESEWELL